MLYGKSGRTSRFLNVDFEKNVFPAFFVLTDYIRSILICLLSCPCKPCTQYRGRNFNAIVLKLGQINICKNNKPIEIEVLSS